MEINHNSTNIIETSQAPVATTDKKSSGSTNFARGAIKIQNAAVIHFDGLNKNSFLNLVRKYDYIAALVACVLLAFFIGARGISLAFWIVFLMAVVIISKNFFKESK